ncbi:hypothetical protein N7462_003991 [Penicillium macrosclerotiorum]|uniref:uncharacterized protein n=1 Tax=Penicillium macrosclerotiorum TaxID=303699 RepID=UPI0025499364|nr:uncharacterized protein N7462_003991 [Penicillium macrosclerotiorum]KAJ5689599.1 hypothetical protein N7462_003991 [Penicillium macrosclerotiorum]
MASKISKRKRDTAPVSRVIESDDASPPPADNAQDIFRKYFEAQFEPLDLPSKDTVNNLDSEMEGEGLDENEDGSELDSDWDGLSRTSDDGNVVEVVEHQDTRLEPKDMMNKQARKAFMTAKPPSSIEKPTKQITKSSKKNDSDDDNDVDNLKHDLDLQRLLRESHLLDSASDLAPTGKNRLKALDLRMQSLGAKDSLYKQKNMPDSHRRGIKEKAALKDEKRRREAKENGIILERPSKVSKSNTGRRERGVGGSSIGKFSGGTLNLSKQDLHSMQKSISRGRSGKSKSKRGRR